MKKLYILALAATFTTASFAQRVATQENFSFSLDNKSHLQNNKAAADTIYSHLAGTPTTYTNTTGGYVVGHNSYDDLSKMQLFDATHGLTTTNGTINNILFWFSHAESSTGNLTYKATIWADNAGTPGNIIGSETINYNAIDTSIANTMSNGVVAWNSVATFSSPITIPTNQKFWAGIELIYAAGDTLGLVSSTDGDFTDAATHTFEEWANNSMNDFASAWGLDIALAIFPVLDITTGIETVSTTTFNVYPNPSNGEFNINLTNNKAANVNVVVRNVVGKTIISKNIKVAGQQTETISLTNYSKGIYFLTVENKTVKLIVE